MVFLTIDVSEQSLESTVGVAKIGTKSLRATVPEGIVVFLGLQEGDKIDWKMDVSNGQKAAIVTRGTRASDRAEQLVNTEKRLKERMSKRKNV